MRCRKRIRCVLIVFFLCFSKEKNQKKGALFQDVFWTLPKNQNGFAKFSTRIKKFFTQSPSYSGEKGGLNTSIRV